MADLIGVEQYLNETAPFNPEEYDVIWKDPMRNYSDFTFTNEKLESCDYPRFWNESGERVLVTSTEPQDANFSRLVGCYDSEFDQVRTDDMSRWPKANGEQYGDTEAFGNFADWQRELSKFASVQDRLREWVSP